MSSWAVFDSWPESAFYGSGAFVPVYLYVLFLIIADWIKKNVH